VQALRCAPFGFAQGRQDDKVLTLLAFGMVIVFMTLIMTKRLSPLIGLILVPIAFAIIGGFGKGLGPMMLDGIRNLAPTGVMLMFAILYFGIMIDTGLFEPFVQRIIRVVHGDPMKIVVGTAVLALLVSLDGDGSTTYMITVAAMLPLYKRLGIRPIVLACVTMLAGGVMNILPWGGPTARAASALGIDSGQIFIPMIPAMIVATLWVLFVARHLGLRERARLALPGSHDLPETDEIEPEPQRTVGDASLRRPHLLPVNAALTAALLTALVMGLLPLPVLFMIAFAIAMLINYPTLAEQKARLNEHAGNVLSVVGLIFAAGIFTGILAGTKMVDAMASSVIHLIPPSLGPYIAVVTAVVSVPFTFFISNDAFYFGVLPILAKAGAAYGVTAAEMGRASVVGQPVHLLSPLVPSTYLLVGLVGVELDEHQRFTLKWALGSVIVLFLIALATAVVPLVGRVR
jgi:CitMHS family citrate-Mg2+:H+ or citrate-Ca2+:H+ symporter